MSCTDSKNSIHTFKGKLHPETVHVYTEMLALSDSVAMLVDAAFLSFLRDGGGCVQPCQGDEI